MPDKTNIFNIPANYHFFESLLFFIKKNFAENSSNLKILLPNQRSCRELKKLFLQKNSHFFLPQIKAISDLSFEDFFEFLPKEKTQKAINELLEIKTLSPNEASFFLSEELKKISFFSHLDFEQNFRIALSLKSLFEEIEREKIDVTKLEEIDDANLAKHRQLTLELIKDFYTSSKNSLLRKNILLPAAYQNFVIKKFCELAGEEDFKQPIIIAGSTGSMLASRNLIKEISKNKNGYVILFGKNDEDFLEENHPQFFLNSLLKFLEIDKNSVENLCEEKFRQSPQDRQTLLATLSLPAAQTIKWQNKKLEIAANSVKNIQIIESQNLVQEARTLVLALKENFTKTKTAAVISNNDELLNLVNLGLKAEALPFNDSRNLGIFDSRLVNFLLLIAEFWESDFDSSNLLALLKSPLCAEFYEQKTLSEFEIKILRQDRSESGLRGILTKISGGEKLENFFKDFVKKVTHAAASDLASHIMHLIQTAENLSQKTWLELLKNEPAQQEIFTCFEELKLQKVPLKKEKLSEVLKLVLSQISYFEESNAAAPIQLLSTIEARLLNFDLVIIASLNEGDFPTIPEENWLGKKIKHDLGIEHSLKKIGQNFYDFCNYLSNQSVIISRSTSNNGAHLIESPFLLKLKTLCKKLQIELQISTPIQPQNLVQAAVVKSTNPKPKKEFRPKKFSITEISKLLADPYAIYAQKILHLKNLDEIDFEPSYAQFGSFVHKALEEFIKTEKTKNFLENSQKIFAEFFLSKEAQLTWWPKFVNIFSDFEQKNSQFSALRNYAEIPVKLPLGEFLISGKIDRVILDETNRAEIFDYKTGEPPAKIKVTDGNEPQLTIAALALLEGIIEEKINLKVGEISSLNYWKVSATKEGEIKKICEKTEEIKILLSAAKSGLERLLNYFDDENIGYISTGKNKDFWHLSRASFKKNESF